MSFDKNTLAGLQQAFQAYVHDAERLDGIVDRIQPDARVSAEFRLGIYERAYRLRLLEALRTDYPGLHALAGDQEFDAIGSAFIAAQPSTYTNLRWYGGELPVFLRSSEEYREYAVLSEMADFEWALATAFDAADEPVMRVEDMAHVAPDDWPGLRFRVHASVQVVSLQWDVVSVWKAAKDEREAEAPEQGDAPVRWIIWRDGLKTLFRSMTEDEATAFDAVREGGSFAEMCELLLQWHDAGEVAVSAVQYLKQWIQAGLFSRMVKE